jgi:AAA+ superfamily predicted ATPase
VSLTQTISWEDANQRYLVEALAEVRAVLAALVAPAASGSTADGSAVLPASELADVRSSMTNPPALDTLCATFGLSAFERQILLMCAGVEMDSRFASLFASAGDGRRQIPTFSLALAAFKEAHWSALSPARPLRHWRLLEVLLGDALTTSPLRIDERILHYLAGVAVFDERLHGLTEPADAAIGLVPSHMAVAQQAARCWARAGHFSTWPLIQLCGADGASKRKVAAAACAAMDLKLRVMPAGSVPQSAAELDFFIRLWEREAALSPMGLMVECDEMETPGAPRESAVSRLLDVARTPLLVSVRQRGKPAERPCLSFDVPRPTSAEQLQIWSDVLGAGSPVLDGNAENLVAHFSLSPSTIYAAAAQALPAVDSAPALTGPEHSRPELRAESSVRDLSAALWDACRVRSRSRLDGLAQRIEPAATWEDLVVPERQKQLLGQIALCLRQRTKVYQKWGFASKGSRGFGITALFAGPSGTGKTMAGEVLANDLRLDLYVIDLSQVVSKYIGETEKNLRNVFDAAEEGTSILLFDEADALFGKRSEVKDSHDRYANIEVSYLLQRMEAYRGLAILTTNRKAALDQAFMRRIRYVVEFPFPDPAQRAEIWRKVFPRQTPTERLQIDRLARLNAAGGNIRNIALGAAFLAADAGEPVRMSHLRAASHTEFEKIEQPLAEAETAGWV